MSDDTKQKMTPEEQAFSDALQRGAGEVMDSLSGFDEIAIAQQFGKDLEDLPYLTTLRAFGFTLLRRAGRTDAEAKKEVMEMRQDAVQQQLHDFGGSGDLMPAEPDSPEGKGDSEHESGPTS